MSYSRSDTYRQQKARSGQRIRRLLVLNLILLVLVVTAVVWLVSGWNSNESGYEAEAASPHPSTATTDAPASTAALPSPSAASPAASASPAESAAVGAVANSESNQVKLAFVGDILPA